MSQKELEGVVTVVVGMAIREGKERRLRETKKQGRTRVVEQWQGLAFWLAAGWRMLVTACPRSLPLPRARRRAQDAMCSVTWGCKVPIVASCFRRLGFQMSELSGAGLARQTQGFI